MAENTPVSRKFLGTTTSALASLHGKERQIAIDATKNTVVVLDGVTNGGHPLAKEATKIIAGSDNVRINNAVESNLSSDITIAVDAPENRIPGGYNSKELLTVSGNWTAPVTGWYRVTCIGGGGGSYYLSTAAYSGTSGEFVTDNVYLEKDTSVPVAIGGVGLNVSTTVLPSSDNQDIFVPATGGATSFGTYLEAEGGKGGQNWQKTHVKFYDSSLPDRDSVSSAEISFFLSSGGGLGSPLNPYYGHGTNGSWKRTTGHGFVAGSQGAVIIEWYDPDKGSAIPAVMADAPVMYAVRAQVANATVYTPDRSRSFVVAADELQAYTARGFITAEAYQAEVDDQGIERYQNWLVSPDTVEERFSMLRMARERRFAEYDQRMTQLEREARLGMDVSAEILAWDNYAQALCALPEQPGAPWDGGGALTPWPVAPDTKQS